MSFWGHRVSAKLVVTSVAVVLLGAFAVAVARPTPREITLVVRGMAFYLEGGELPNPTLTLKAGERVRVVLRNEERGMQHDFAVPAMRAALDPVGWNESSDATFVVPETLGVYDYWCRPHMTMMRGKIIVQD
jgi:plastocyanin